MGLFSRKKQENSMPQFPQFPKLPEQEPAYQPEFQKKFQPLPANEIPATPRMFDDRIVQKQETEHDFLSSPISPPLPEQHDDMPMLPEMPDDNMQMMLPDDQAQHEMQMPFPQVYDDRFSRPMQNI